jgi:hypothetical protein
MTIATKEDAVIYQAKEELGARPRAFFRYLQLRMNPIDFDAMIEMLLTNYDATRANTLAQIPDDSATLPEGTWDDPPEEP